MFFRLWKTNDVPTGCLNRWTRWDEGRSWMKMGQDGLRWIKLRSMKVDWNAMAWHGLETSLYQEVGVLTALAPSCSTQTFTACTLTAPKLLQFCCTLAVPGVLTSPVLLQHVVCCSALPSGHKLFRRKWRNESWRNKKHVLKRLNKGLKFKRIKMTKSGNLHFHESGYIKTCFTIFHHPFCAFQQTRRNVRELGGVTRVSSRIAQM